MASEQREPVLLGHVAGPHGIAGAVRVHLYNAASTTLRADLDVELRRGPDERQTLTVDRIAAKPGSDLVRVWFRTIADRDCAEALRGCEVWVERGQLPAVAADEYYLGDLIGNEVVRRVEGGRFESLGTIVGVATNGMQDLFEISLAGQTWLLPAMPPFVVEVVGTRVVVDVHEDLLPESSG